MTATLIHSLYQIGAIQFGEFTLKSGKTSTIYINLRKIISYPKLLVAIAHYMSQATAHCRFDTVCGVPYTALPIATCLSVEHNIPMVMRRKETKDYGTKQRIEGVFKNGQTCLIIEDVITTGSSIIETADDLRAEGLVVNDVVVLVDREQGGRQQLEKHFRVFTLLTLSQILNTLLESTLLNDQERKAIHIFQTEQLA